ncbi:MAG TPA: CoA transferase [Candidatus Binataceae bacterium]|nr:CoA transferase [Candidatus Binataceae bacterium]
MLSPYRVLDLTNERGLLCAQILGDLGADVIKIEPPGGSPARKIGPFFEDQPDPNRSLFWWSYNRNKRSITLDYARTDGREVLFRLAKDAHFIIESDSPGYLASLGLGYADLAAKNPALIGVSITPFGQDGPKANYADADLVILAAGGPLVLTGDDDRPPLRISVPQGYLHACADGAVGALAAHHERCLSGLGQHVDISAQQSLALATQSGILAAPFGADQFRRLAGGVKSGAMFSQSRWPAKDGWISCTFLFGSALGVFTTKLMRYLGEQGWCDEETAHKDFIGFGQALATGVEPMSEYARVRGILESFTAAHTKDELMRLALEKGFLFAPVTTIEEVAESPQLRARDYFQDLEHPELGRSFRYPGPFVKFSESPIRYRRRPPLIGEHNREIYCGEMGMSDRELSQLQAGGVI